MRPEKTQLTHPPISEWLKVWKKIYQDHWDTCKKKKCHICFRGKCDYKRQGK